MIENHFLDVPIYRLDSQTYYSKRDERIESALIASWRGLSPTEEQLKTGRERREQHFYDSYGPWQFNEIVGYIRLYFLGNQIRGEHFSAEGKRVSLGRTRVFKWWSYKLATELQLWGNPTSDEIYRSVHEYLDRCQKELRNGRYIDRRNLNALGPHVDWNSLLKSKIQKVSESE